MQPLLSSAADQDSDHAAQWQALMDEKIASLGANQTWVLEDLPAHANIIWVFKLETDADRAR